MANIKSVIYAELFESLNKFSVVVCYTDHNLQQRMADWSDFERKQQAIEYMLTNFGIKYFVNNTKKTTRNGVLLQVTDDNKLSRNISNETKKPLTKNSEQKNDWTNIGKNPLDIKSDDIQTDNATNANNKVKANIHKPKVCQVNWDLFKRKEFGKELSEKEKSSDYKSSDYKSSDHISGDRNQKVNWDLFKRKEFGKEPSSSCNKKTNWVKKPSKYIPPSKRQKERNWSSMKTSK